MAATSRQRKQKAESKSKAAPKKPAAKKSQRKPETDIGPQCKTCKGTTRFEEGTCPDCDPGQ